MKRLHHGFLLNSQDGTVRHCGCSAHAESLACKRAFAEETSLAQYTDGGFLASLRHYREFHFSYLEIKHRVCRTPLREDGLLLGKEHTFSALTDGGEECLGIKLAAFFGNCTRTHRP